MTSEKIRKEYQSYCAIKRKQKQYEENGDIRTAYLKNFDALYRLITILMYLETDLKELNHPIARDLLCHKFNLIPFEEWRNIYKHRCNLKYGKETQVKSYLFNRLRQLESTLMHKISISVPILF